MESARAYLNDSDFLVENIPSPRNGDPNVKVEMSSTK